MFLSPGLGVFLSREKEKYSCNAVVVCVDEESCLVMVEKLFGAGTRQLVTGEVIRIEIPQQGDAVYVIYATAAEVIEKGAIILLLLKKFSYPARHQRRESERAPVILKASYLLVPEKGSANLKEEVKSNKGLILDLSEGGFLLAVRTPLPLGGELYCSYEVVTGEERQLVGVVGKAVRRHLPFNEKHNFFWSYYFGIQFKSQPRSSRLKLIC